MLQTMDDNRFKPLNETASNFSTANGGGISTPTIHRNIHRA